MEPCATNQNTHHQLTVVIGSQWGKTCWPFRFKLMSNINDTVFNTVNSNIPQMSLVGKTRKALGRNYLETIRTCY